MELSAGFDSYSQRLLVSPPPRLEGNNFQLEKVSFLSQVSPLKFLLLSTSADAYAGIGHERNFHESHVRLSELRLVNSRSALISTPDW